MQPWLVSSRRRKFTHAGCLVRYLRISLGYARTQSELCQESTRKFGRATTTKQFPQQLGDFNSLYCTPIVERIGLRGLARKWKLKYPNVIPLDYEGYCVGYEEQLRREASKRLRIFGDPHPQRSKAKIKRFFDQWKQGLAFKDSQYIASDDESIHVFACPLSFLHVFVQTYRSTVFNTRRSGVYCLIGVNEFGRRCYYIGSSDNIAVRMYEYRNDVPQNTEAKHFARIDEMIFFVCTSDSFDARNIEFQLMRQARLNVGILLNSRGMSHPEISAVTHDNLNKIRRLTTRLGHTFLDVSFDLAAA